jgi:hypothetical protein
MTALSVYRLSGYGRVWRKLAAGPAGLDLPSPSEKALRDLRRRGPAPLEALFEIVARPLVQAHRPGVRFAGLRTVVFDGCNSVKFPDTGRSWSWVGKVRSAKFTDRVAVRLVSGQAAADFAARSENLAHGFGAVLCWPQRPARMPCWLPLRLLLRKLVELLSGRPPTDMTAVQVDQRGPGAALPHAVHQLAQRGTTVRGAVLDRRMIKDIHASSAGQALRLARGRQELGPAGALTEATCQGSRRFWCLRPGSHGGAGSSPARRARISPTVRSRLVGSGSGRCSWIW